jgi:single-stranded DNA-binding protein
VGIRDAYLEGNLTRDPECVAAGEWSIIKFSVACNESRKQPSGEYADHPHFFNCEYWTKKPQYWLKNMLKGKGIVCKCEIVQDRWEQDGQQRQAVKFKLVGWPVLMSSAQSNMSNTPASSTPSVKQQDFEDDIPF